jgi:hypothetical protein
MNYEDKYYKYKQKYIQLKYGGSNKQCVNLKDKLKVYELFINDKWKFNKKFPNDILSGPEDQILPEKIWFIKKTIRMNTYYDNKKKLLHNYHHLMPRDLCIFKSCLNRDELNEIYKHLGKIFSEYKELDIIYSHQPIRGLTYLFTGDNQITQYADKTMEFIRSYNYDFYKLLTNIFIGIANIYNMEVEYLYKYIQLVPLKYEQNNGIWLHIDNVARYDQGPIITISIGPEVSYVDFTPTLLHSNTQLKPIRIELDEGDIVIMDGSSRMEWAHGLPSNTPYKKTKYTLLFKCDKFGERRSFTNKLLDTTITSSKILCR